MFGQVKFSYISKTKPVNAILAAIKKSSGLISSYKIIDNVSSGIRMYPKEVQTFVERCEEGDILYKVDDLIDSGIDLIIINDFNITLDDVKDYYAERAKDADVAIYINQSMDIPKNHNISVMIDPAVIEIEDEEWDEIKEEILENMDKAILEEAEEQEEEDKDTQKDSSKLGEDFKNLLDIFNLGDLYSDEDSSNREALLGDVDILEQYAHSVGDDHLYISLTDNGDIVIDDENECVKIPHTQFRFLMQTLKEFIKE